MNYEYYKIFYCVGKHKNITRAAEELYSSQPAVTRFIQNMESELNCRLFVRTKKGVEFTHEGELLYEYVSVACDHLVKAEETLQQNGSVEGGTVYIGATVTALTCYLFDFLNKFRNKYPKVKLKIWTGSTHTTVSNLENGRVDLAFVTTPCTVNKPMVTTDLLRFQDVLIGGKEYAFLAEKGLNVETIFRYPFVTLRKGMQLRQFLDDWFADYGVTLAPDIESDGANLMILTVRNGLGLAFAPEPMAREDIARGELVRIPFEQPFPSRKVCLVTNPHLPQTPASREMFRMVTQDARGTN